MRGMRRDVAPNRRRPRGGRLFTLETSASPGAHRESKARGCATGAGGPEPPTVVDPPYFEGVEW